MNYKSSVLTPFGQYILTSDGSNLTGLYLENQSYFPDLTGFLDEDLEIFRLTKIWLNDYFAGQIPVLNFPVKPAGTAFRQKVWQILTKIPYGQTTTYGEIAKLLNIKSAQAIGGAVGHNPISLIIPCHRVIAQNGSLTGYAGGIEVKKKLLEMEENTIQ